ncbi:hypothetical protein LEMLEM_LOCUS15544 [Lemmus lemmus]
MQPSRAEYSRKAKLNTGRQKAESRESPEAAREVRCQSIIENDALHLLEYSQFSKAGFSCWYERLPSAGSLNLQEINWSHLGLAGERPLDTTESSH